MVRIEGRYLGGLRCEATHGPSGSTLRTDAPLFQDVEQLRWHGPTAAFGTWTQRIGAPRLLERSRKGYAPR